jgi:peptide deformylase
VAIKPVLRLGHPVLREVASAYPASLIGSSEFVALIADMTDTLAEQGGIGLAAPQIGVSLRIAIIDIPGGPTRYGELSAMPLSVFVNPEIEVIDPSPAGYWEGCLSVPGMRGFVERPQHIRVTYLDRDARQQSLELQGFAATVLQHEFDHLDGRIYVDHIKDMRLFVFEPEFEQFVLPELMPSPSA